MIGRKKCECDCKYCTHSCSKKKRPLISYNGYLKEEQTNEKDVEELLAYLERRWGKPRNLVNAIMENRDEILEYEYRADWELVASYLFRVVDALDLKISSTDIDDIASSIVYGRFELIKGETIYVDGC